MIFKSLVAEQVEAYQTSHNSKQSKVQILCMHNRKYQFPTYSTLNATSFRLESPINHTVKQIG